MFEFFLNGLGVVFLWLAVEYCLRRETADSLDEASMVPFADDPEVARRVELATGKTVKAVAPQALKPGWGNLDI